MRLQEIGHSIRRARIGRGLTQSELAQGAGLSRATVNRLEMGNFPDLGVQKLQALLEDVGLTLALLPSPKTRKPDYIRLASTAASVSFKEALTEAELIRALLSGKIPSGRRPHFRKLFEEVGSNLMRGLVSEVSRWSKPGKVEKSIAAIANIVGATERIPQWLTTA